LERILAKKTSHGARPGQARDDKEFFELQDLPIRATLRRKRAEAIGAEAAIETLETPLTYACRLYIQRYSAGGGCLSAGAEGVLRLLAAPIARLRPLGATAAATTATGASAAASAGEGAADPDGALAAAERSVEYGGPGEEPERAYQTQPLDLSMAPPHSMDDSVLSGAGASAHAATAAAAPAAQTADSVDRRRGPVPLAVFAVPAAVSTAASAAAYAPDFSVSSVGGSTAQGGAAAMEREVDRLLGSFLTLQDLGAEADYHAALEASLLFLEALPLPRSSVPALPGALPGGVDGSGALAPYAYLSPLQLCILGDGNPLELVGAGGSGDSGVEDETVIDDEEDDTTERDEGLASGSPAPDAPAAGNAEESSALDSSFWSIGSFTLPIALPSLSLPSLSLPSFSLSPTRKAPPPADSSAESAVDAPAEASAAALPTTAAATPVAGVPTQIMNILVEGARQASGTLLPGADPACRREDSCLSMLINGQSSTAYPVGDPILDGLVPMHGALDASGTEEGALARAAAAGGEVGWTPLMAASALGAVDAVRLLLSLRGHDGTPLIEADASAPVSGATALLLAAERGHLPIVALLLEHSRSGTGAVGLEAATGDGRTALALACEFGHLECARALLEAGARTAGAYLSSEAIEQLLIFANSPPRVPSATEHSDKLIDGRNFQDVDAPPSPSRSTAAATKPSAVPATPPRVAQPARGKEASTGVSAAAAALSIEASPVRASPARHPRTTAGPASPAAVALSLPPVVETPSKSAEGAAEEAGPMTAEDGAGGQSPSTGFGEEDAATLLQHQEELDLANKQPITLAAMKGHWDVVRLLQSFGADDRHITAMQMQWLHELA
jgi:hypothetical protein